MTDTLTSLLQWALTDGTPAERRVLAEQIPAALQRRGADQVQVQITEPPERIVPTPVPTVPEVRPGDECICRHPADPMCDGPEEDCPRHGRSYSYWVERVDRLMRERDALERQMADHLASGPCSQTDQTEPPRLAGPWYRQEIDPQALLFAAVPHRYIEQAAREAWERLRRELGEAVDVGARRVRITVEYVDADTGRIERRLRENEPRRSYQAERMARSTEQRVAERPTVRTRTTNLPLVG